MLPVRPCGRCTTSANTQSGRTRSSARRCARDPVAEVVVGVAEAAEQPGPGRAAGRADQHPVLTAPDSVLRLGDDDGHYVEGPGQRRIVGTRRSSASAAPIEISSRPGRDGAVSLR